jgi:hypothetical protein
MAENELGSFMRRYIQRVVNEHDLSGVDEMVSPHYRGIGPDWERLAPNFETAREFYRRQAIQRPDWRIDIQETIELGEYVAVRAYAHGVQAFDDDGASRRPPFPIEVEWFTVSRIVDGKIVEGRMITWVIRSES